MSMDYQAVLDLIAVLVADGNMEEMVEDLLNLLLKNAMANYAVLLLNVDGKMQLHNFKYTGDMAQELASVDLPLLMERVDVRALPHRIINYVAEKKTPAVVNSSDNEFGFLSDPYLDEHRPESFACLPMMANNALIGVIYLENTYLPGVFPAARARFLNTIAAQSGLILRNAMETRNMADYNADLEKRLRSYTQQMNTLIGGIAHEINTPLGVCVTLATGLQGLTQKAQEDFNGQVMTKSELVDYFNESAEGLGILMGNITRTTDLVQNFKKITVNQTAGRFETIDIIPELANIIDYVRPAIKNIVGSCAVQGPESLKMHTSSGALAQIFTNLIMNSAIHAFGGMQKQDCKIEITIVDGADSVSVTYVDNGRGMSKEEQEQFFIPFFTMRRAEGGSGLGGHIIFSMVTQTLGGSIQVSSAPGHGCRFYMIFPKLEAGSGGDK
jgi:signal transduction histidine kinase